MRRISSLLLLPALLTCIAIGATAAQGAVAQTVRIDRDGACTAIESEGAGAAKPRYLAAPTKLVIDADPAASATVNETTTVGPLEVAVERELAAGEAFTCIVTVRNRNRERMTYDFVPVGITGGDDAGVDILDLDDPATANTAASWLVPVMRSVTLNSRGVARVPVTVTVPADPPVGAAYAFLQVKPRVTGAGDAAVGVSSSVAVAFLVRVGGQGRAKLALHNQRAPHLRFNRASFHYRARLTNDGNLHARPTGRVRVRSIFGSTVATLGVSGRTLLPHGSEPVSTTWRGVPWFGFYRYDVRITTVDGTPATATGWFVALPPWWMLAIVALVVVLLVGGAIVRRRREADWHDYVDEDDAVNPADEQQR